MSYIESLYYFFIKNKHFFNNCFVFYIFFFTIFIMYIHGFASMFSAFRKVFQDVFGCLPAFSNCISVL